MMTGRSVLVVGSGGREHALCLALLRSDSVSSVIAVPGNAGMKSAPAWAQGKTLQVRTGEPEELAVDEKVDLVVIGPEIPLCDGLADRIRARGIPCFGPSQAAARLEGSKAFMKDFCSRHGIRTARDVVVQDLGDLASALSTFEEPPVVKADGLCAGKGVVVAESFAEAEEAARRMLSGDAFGAAGTTVVLEQRLLGQEASIHAICDGDSFILLPAAQDHKRIYEGDRGPNTGGMGSYAPAPVVDEPMFETIREQVIRRVVDGMREDGTPFVGTLFAGLMISPEGEPVVLEYNVRFGDPETQVLTQIVDGDWGEALLQAAEGRLEPAVLRSTQEHAVCVVMAAAGYPESPKKGDRIVGLLEAEAQPGALVLHAGTALVEEGVVTAGGRVLGVSARGSSLQEARDRAYQAVDCIRFPGAQVRRDIGHRALSLSAHEDRG